MKMSQLQKKAQNVITVTFVSPLQCKVYCFVFSFSPLTIKTKFAGLSSIRSLGYALKNHHHLVTVLTLDLLSLL